MDLVVIGLIFCTSGVLFLLAMAKLRLVRIIEDIPTSRIRSASQGYVEIKGRTGLNGKPALYVPRLKVPCVWYSYQVFRENNDGHHDNEEKDSESINGIYLEDNTGVCLLHAHHAQIYPKNVVEHYEAGVTHKMSWIGVGEYVYALGWLKTLHPAPRVNDVISKQSEEKPELRYGQLSEPLGTLTKHPNGFYPLLVWADYEHRVIAKLRGSVKRWLIASVAMAFMGLVVVVMLRTFG
jgi:hypothetical protein